MDGPMVRITAPLGVLALIQLPVSRTPGIPPVPARNVVDCEGWMAFRLGTSSEMATTAGSALASIDRRKLHCGDSLAPNGDHEATARAARMANTGATGSRY